MIRATTAGLVALALAAIGGSGPVGALTLAEDGSTAYRIVVGDEAGPAARRSAEVLTETLSRITGASFPVAGQAGEHPAIRLRRASGAADSAPDSPDAFRFAARGDDLVITGNSGRGLFYAVHHLLERQAGVHWFGAEQPDIPDRPTLHVQAEGEWHSPRFAYREVFFRHADQPLFSARNRLNGRFGHRLQQRIPAELGGDRALDKVHIFELVPPETYRGSDPDFYADGQLRFSGRDVQRAAKRHLRDYMAQWDEPPAYLMIEHADRGTYFDDGTDARLIDRHGAPSAAFIDFVRALADVVAQSHPDVTVLAQSYLWSREPPRDMDLPGNMGVMLAGIEQDFSKPIDAPANQAFIEDLDGWGELTPHVVIWDYVTNFAGYIQPYPDIHTYADNLQALAQRDHVEGVFAQGAYQTPGTAFAELRTWLLARLMWDPDRDAGQLIDTFMSGYYGPAAPQMGAYLEQLTAAAERWPGKLRAKTPPSAGYLDAEFLHRADRLMAQAETATADQAQYQRRVRTARIAVDYAVLANRARLRESGGADWLDTEQRLDRLERNLKAAGVTAYREGGGAGIDSLLQQLAVDRDQPQQPTLCDDRPAADCRVVEDLALQLVGGGASLVSDDAAADGAAAAMPGDSRAWGIQLPLADLLPENGQWRIHVRVRAELESGQDVPAFQAGVEPGGNQTYAASAGSGYRTLRVPGRYAHDAERYLWFAPAHESQVERFLVDRVIAVRADSEGQ